MLATYARENHQDIIFHLKESPSDEKDIYTETFNASSMVDNAYRTFSFPPIPDSKGKMLFFSFESPQSRMGDAITIWSTDKDTYKEGALIRNGKKSDGDLRFITYFSEENSSSNSRS